MNPNSFSFWNWPPLAFPTLLQVAVLGAAVAGVSCAVATRKLFGRAYVWYVYVITALTVGWLVIHPRNISYLQLQRIVNFEGLVAIGGLISASRGYFRRAQ